MKVALRTLAYARSGDKGSNANIGLVARSEKFYLFLQQNLTAEKVQDYFQEKNPKKTIRFELPHLLAFNFLLLGALDGGVSYTLRSDSQGKGLAQELLNMQIDIPPEYI